MGVGAFERNSSQQFGFSFFIDLKQSELQKSEANMLLRFRRVVVRNPRHQKQYGTVALTLRCVQCYSAQSVGRPRIFCAWSTLQTGHLWGQTVTWRSATVNESNICLRNFRMEFGWFCIACCMRWKLLVPYWWVLLCCVGVSWQGIGNVWWDYLKFALKPLEPLRLDPCLMAPMCQGPSISHCFPG